MTDYSEQGAVPVEGAVVDDPPTAGEVIEQQRAEDAQRGRASTTPTEEELATEEAGGEVVGITPSGAPEIEGPNSA